MLRIGMYSISYVQSLYPREGFQQPSHLSSDIAIPMWEKVVVIQKNPLAVG